MKTHSRHVVLLCTALTAGLSLCPDAAAAPLTPEEALARALPAATRSSLPSSQSDWKLVYTSKVPEVDSVAGCYLYKSSDGFVVASADDRAIPLLAYGDDPVFAADSLSPEFEYWLGEYGRQMYAAPDVPHVADTVKYKDPLGPLCKTRWNQFAPYNDMCSKEYGRGVVTGCVATALAQVLKYHNWPPTGEGEHSYSWDGHHFSFDYATAQFDWAQMTDGYDRRSTAEEKAAVSELMYACGVLVGMHYAPGGSGADPAGIAGGLPTHMKYDRSCYDAQRAYYGLTEWEDLIYDQLTTHGPVQYSGYVSSGGGHSFVCDGYERGYFHINWGWGGGNDGYYMLTALKPVHDGIGAYEDMGGFNFNQSAIVNIFPAGETPSQPTVSVVNASNFKVRQNYAYAGGGITLDGAYWNNSPFELDGEFGVAAVGESGDTIYMNGRVITDYWSGEGWGSYSAHIPGDIPVGTYKLSPVFKAYGIWYPIRTAIGCRNQADMTVEQDGTRKKCVFGSVALDAVLTAQDIETRAEIDPTKYIPVRGTLTNTGTSEWLGGICSGLFTTDGKLIAHGLRMEIDLAAGGEEPLEYSSPFKYVVLPDSLHNGPAQLYVLDYDSKKPISDGVRVTVIDSGTAVAKTLPDDGGNALSGPVTVMTLQGVTVGHRDADDFADGLPRGLYIVRDGAGHTRKIAL